MKKIDQFHKEVGILVHGDVWNRNLPIIQIDKEYKIELMMHTDRIRGSVRLRSGLFDTVEEREKIKKRILATPLP